MKQFKYRSKNYIFEKKKHTYILFFEQMTRIYDIFNVQVRDYVFKNYFMIFKTLFLNNLRFLPV